MLDARSGLLFTLLTIVANHQAFGAAGFSVVFFDHSHFCVRFSRHPELQASKAQRACLVPMSSRLRCRVLLYNIEE